jgi:methionyl-tRNA formyltransferase
MCLAMQMTRAVDTVCLLLGGSSVPVAFAESVERMVEKTDVEIVCVIIATSATEAERENRGFLSRIERWGPIRRLKRSLTQTGKSVEITSISSVSEADLVRCEVEPTDGAAVSLPDEVIDDVADQADVVIHEGVGILIGRILSVPEQGVLGFHHGDIREYRGIGYGFWEYMHGADQSGVTLQRLNETLDAGEIIDIQQVDISDANTYSEVRRRLQRASIPMLATGIRRLRDPEFTPERVPEAELGTVYYSSQVDLRVRVQYLYKEIANRIKHATSQQD